MVEVIYLQPGEKMPAVANDQLWLMVEARDDGRFFGTGFARKPSGEGVFYVSLPETDASLEQALDAARPWAAKYSVPQV